MLNKVSLPTFLCLFLVAGAHAQSPQDPEILAKITPEAIDSRIAEIRMGDLIVKTRPGAKVRIKQVRHEFLFGTAIPNSLAENSENPMSPEDREQYLRLLSDNFNYAVHENALKWYGNEKERGVVDYSVADRIWELCKSLNIPMRGHTIYWEKEEFNEEWLKELNNDELRLAIKNRAESLMNHFKDRIDEYDLNNEMLHGNFFRRRFGYGIVSEMAWMVKAHNPDAKLYMNDYGIADVGYNAGPYAWGPVPPGRGRPARTLPADPPRQPPCSPRASPRRPHPAPAVSSPGPPPRSARPGRPPHLRPPHPTPPERTPHPPPSVHRGAPPPTAVPPC